MRFDGMGLKMNHYKETTKREGHRAIDVVGGEDGDVLKSSRSKSHDRVPTLMREIHPIDDSDHHEVQLQKANTAPKPIPRVEQIEEWGFADLFRSDEESYGIEEEIPIFLQFETTRVVENVAGVIREGVRFGVEPEIMGLSQVCRRTSHEERGVATKILNQINRVINFTVGNFRDGNQGVRLPYEVAAKPESPRVTGTIGEEETHVQVTFGGHESDTQGMPIGMPKGTQLHKLAARIVYVPKQLRQPNQNVKALLCGLTLDTQLVDSFWQEFENRPRTVIYKFLGNPDSASHRLFGNKIVCRSAGKIIRQTKWVPWTDWQSSSSQRATNVFSCGYLVNLVRPANRQIPLKHQKALWYSGLRGAMAFALALQSVHDLPEGHGRTILTATTAIVVVTVLLIGGSTGTMLEALDVVGDAHDVPLGEAFETNNGYMAPSYDEGASSGTKLKMKLKEFQKSTASFTALDKNYLTPFFTTQNGDEEELDDLPVNPRRGRGFRARV
ncbi:hypothetical protein GIB67_035275 [Kingdonia uniflora]|uniref:Uncharacterized protein n=1 Tax=Kingdonia uniflora TaxID=39325 RepID=A0A7J7KY54_9MAGN|nr:hypothetical protein GIB67_035275 [Kingdonia uniflora]